MLSQYKFRNQRSNNSHKRVQKTNQNNKFETIELYSKITSRGKPRDLVRLYSYYKTSAFFAVNLTYRVN